VPRPPASEPYKNWKVCLSAALAGAVEFELMDPLTKKPQYGERARLLEQLLSEWLEKRRAERNTETLLNG